MLDTDRKRFTTIDRASYKWIREYNKRPSVERVNGRLDESFGFEKHYMRRKNKDESKMWDRLMCYASYGIRKDQRNEKRKNADFLEIRFLCK